MKFRNGRDRFVIDDPHGKISIFEQRRFMRKFMKRVRAIKEGKAIVIIARLNGEQG